MNDGVMTMFKLEKPVRNAKISYDKKYIYTLEDDSFSIWDLNNLMLLKRIPVKTSSLYPHPADSRLLYVEGNYEITNFSIVNWETEETVGFVAPETVPKFMPPSDYLFFNNAPGILIILTTDNATPIGYLGSISIDTGTARTNYNDSLLITSGMVPQLWDLKKAKLIDDITYLKYLKNIPFKQEVPLQEYSRIPYYNDIKPGNPPYNSYFLPGSNRVVLGGVKDSVTIWNINEKTGELYLEKSITVGTGPSMALSFHGDTIIAATPMGLFRSIALQTFDWMPEYGKASSSNEFYSLSPSFADGRFLAGSTEKIWNKPTLLEGKFDSDEPLRKSNTSFYNVRDIKISPNENYAVAVYGQNSISKINLKGDTLKYDNPLKKELQEYEHFTRCEILPDETIVAGTNIGNLIFWKKDEEFPFFKLEAHRSKINSITLSSDGTKMITSDPSGQIKLWNTATLEPIVTLYQIFGINEGSYIILTPDNYYKTTTDAHQFINFVKDGKGYDFEQFDLRNNRPDIIVERLGGDPKEVELFHKAWLKRLKRAGITEENLSPDYHVPDAVITNRDLIPSIAYDNKVTLDLSFNDSLYNLKEISVALNGVEVLPIFRRQINQKSASLSLPLDLATGNNQIVVTALNERGARSAREVIRVVGSQKQENAPKLYIVAVGVSDYNNKAYKLGYASKDAKDFANVIKKNIGKEYSEVKTLLLTDEDFSQGELKNIKDFLSDSTRDDVVMLFYAGHGILDSELNYYLAPADIDFSNPDINGILYEDFLGVLDGIDSVNRFCFIDACHSGELDKEDYLAINTVEMPIGEELVFRNAGNIVKAREEAEKINSIIDDLFYDVSWNRGASVLSSSGGAEFAVESPEWKNGLFTYNLKKALETKDADLNNDGHINLKELGDYIITNVREMSEGRQTPVLSSNQFNQNKTLK